MTRPYPHRPDEPWIERRYRSVVRNLDAANRTIGSAEADVYIIDAAVDLALQATAFGWFLEVPLEQLRQYLGLGNRCVRQGLLTADGAVPGLAGVSRWIATSLLAADRETAALAGARVPDLAAVQQPSDEFDVMLAALSKGADGAGEAAAKALTTALLHPTTPPITSRSYAHLDELGRAVRARDQEMFEAAARRRDEAVLQNHRRTVQDRRSWMALLDHRASALILLGASRALTPPRTLLTVPFELLPLDS